MTTAKEGMYMITKITSGSVVERRKTYVGRRPSRRGARIKGASSEKKQENNRQQAILALARTLNCNYTNGDGYVATPRQKELYREINPNATDDEINAAYGEFYKQ